MTIPSTAETPDTSDTSDRARGAPTVFVTAPELAAPGTDLLRQAGCRILYLPVDDDGTAVARIMAGEPVDAVISRTVALTGADIAACPTLRIVCKHGVGVGNIDVPAATRRSIPVCVTPGANAQSVAEMTLGLMFAAARRIVWMDGELRAGRWSRAQDGFELHGRTLGLIGLGEVGRRVATVALALGMRVVAFDPGTRESSPTLQAVHRLSSVDEVLAASEVVSLHVPLTAATRGLIDTARIARMRPGAILVNTARGEVVDEAALIGALRSGQLRAAGLDTMTHEPLPPGSPLLLLPNVVLTPHVGGSTPAALGAMALGAAQTVLQFLQSGRLDPSVCINAASLPSIASSSPKGLA